PDLSAWSLADALGFPVPQTHSTANPSGITLGQRFQQTSAFNQLELLPSTVIDAVFKRQAPSQVKKAADRLRQPSDTLIYHLVHFISLASPPFPSSFSFSTLLTLLLAADVSFQA